MASFLRRKQGISVETVTDTLSSMSLTPQKRVPITIGQEIDWSVQEWYTQRGLPVPESDKGWGEKYDAELRKEYDADLSPELYQRFYMRKNPSPSKPVVIVSSAGEKPEFGTPEFWAWARRRKLEKEKEAAVKAVEKEAAAAAKAAAKEAAKAEKIASKASKKTK
jgi:hypothetical protein